MPKDIKQILVAGFGSIGKRHAANLRLLYPDAAITILHTSGNAHAEDDEFTHLYRIEDALSLKPQAAWITSPAPCHVDLANTLADHHCHLFIEKPVSTTLNGLEKLAETASANNLVVMIGYTLRFNQALNALRDALMENRIGDPLHAHATVGQYLPDWRPSVDYRNTVSAQSALGGGAVFELSHELDYVSWLLGPFASIQAVTSNQSNLEIDVEDTAEITAVHVNGVLSNIHLDMTSRVPSRALTITGTDGVLHWDAIKQLVTIQHPGDQDATELLDPATKQNDMYLEQTRHFMACIQDEAEPMASLDEGTAVLITALAVKEAAATERTVKL